MNVFKNKFLIKLIVLMCLCLTILSVGLKNKVYATDKDEEIEEIWGSILLTPMVQLITGIGDGIMDILHQTILEQEVSLVKIDGSPDWWEKYGIYVAIIIVAVILIAIISQGLGSVAGVLISKGILAASANLTIQVATLSTVLGGIGGYLIVERLDHEIFPQDVYLPVYNFTPQEIFSNKIALFDINFFEENKYTKEEKKETLTEDWINEQYAEDDLSVSPGYEYEEFRKAVYKFVNSGTSWQNLYEAVNYVYPDGTETGKEIKKICEKINEKYGEEKIPINDSNTKWKIGFTSNGEYVELANEGDKKISDFDIIMNIYDEKSNWVFAVESSKFEVVENNNSAYEKIYSYDESFTVDMRQFEIIEEKAKSIVQYLRNIVSSWYYSLRNLAIIALMLVLIYVGIKIVLESSAGEKAKYKERLMDWFVAICLVYVMHYIMAFAVNLNEKLIELIDTSTINRVEKVIGLGTEDSLKYQHAVQSGELNDLIYDDGNGNYFVFWETDLMGGIRIKSQELYEGTAKWVGFSMCYIVLVLYTCFFAWIYLKRVAYIALLTMISPLVAMTYPIDKITDGKAQAFNAWIKEYIFNLLIQPMHLLLYTILISSAYELAVNNVLYSIVAIGFMTPAEKLIRKFFGFDKAQTPGLLGGATGAALAMTGLQKLMKFGQKQEGRSHEDSNEDSEESNKIKFSSSEGVNAIDLATKDAIKKENKQQGIHFKGKQNLTENDLDKNYSEYSETNVPVNFMAYNKDKANNYDKSNFDIQNYVNANKYNRVNSHNEQNSNIATEVPHKNRHNNKYDTDNSLNNKSTNKKGRLGRTLRAVGSAYGRQMKGKALKRLKRGRPIRAIARGITGLAGGATFGMLGLALGIASGDPNKAFQYTTGAAIGGYQAGKGVAGAAVDTLSVDQQKMKDEMELAWYGDKYKRFKFEEYKKKIIEDEDNIDYIRKTMGKSKKQAEEILKTTGSKCIDSGIRDIEDIAAVHQMKEDIIEEQDSIRMQDNYLSDDNKEKATGEKKERDIREEEALRHAIAIKKLSDRLPSDIHKMGEKKIEGYRKQFRRELENKLKEQLIKLGKSEEIAADLAKNKAESVSKDMIKEIIRFADTKAHLSEA